MLIDRKGLNIRTIKVKGHILLVTRYNDFSVQIERRNGNNKIEIIDLTPQELFLEWLVKEYGEEAWNI